MKLFYAEFQPRGFANEVLIQAFINKELRDCFVHKIPRTRYSEEYQTSLNEEPSAKAYEITAKNAEKILRPQFPYLNCKNIHEYFHEKPAPEVSENFPTKTIIII